MQQQVIKLYYGTEILLTVALENKQGTKSNNTHLYDCWYIWTLHLEGYSSRTKQQRNTKCETQSAKGLWYQSKAQLMSGNLYVWC